jgi:hypothetical protein
MGMHGRLNPQFLLDVHLQNSLQSVHQYALTLSSPRPSFKTGDPNAPNLKHQTILMNKEGNMIFWI